MRSSAAGLLDKNNAKFPRERDFENSPDIKARANIMHDEALKMGGSPEQIKTWKTIAMGGMGLLRKKIAENPTGFLSVGAAMSGLSLQDDQAPSR